MKFLPSRNLDPNSIVKAKFFITAAAAKSLQSCPTLCDPIDGSPSGSPVPGILQARTLEWVAISFSNAWKWKVKGKSLSRVWLLATPWTAAHQAPLSMEFARQEYRSGLPLPSFIATRFLKGFVVVLIRCLFYTQQCVCVGPTLPIHLTSPWPPWHPYVCSLCLCLYFCVANKFICTILHQLFWELISFHWRP